MFAYEVYAMMPIELSDDEISEEEVLVNIFVSRDETVAKKRAHSERDRVSRKVPDHLVGGKFFVRRLDKIVDCDNE